MTPQEASYKLGLATGKLEKLSEEAKSAGLDDEFLNQFQEVKKLLVECAQYFLQEIL